MERQLDVLAEADFSNLLVQASGDYEILGEDKVVWEDWLEE